ncbi:PREDICTED: uncharacterized protein LOC109216403 isoform X1 [Nicotiana attenuata]|uniref:uncharacterized protein LOC109216403 isoform X1 n=1 Tax=Nicotiana attenuata TaxID=49451 RepID=UPI0009046252|nr:PREDICTED: uncharacterized protein LOC109216403 isoform X1 [Nicotiana attenuata]
MRKYAPNASMPQSSNGTLGEEIPDANSGYERVPQISRMPSVAENAQPSHVAQVQIHGSMPSCLIFQHVRIMSYSLMFDNLAVGRFQNDEKLRKSFEDHHSGLLL